MSKTQFFTAILATSTLYNCVAAAPKATNSTAKTSTIKSRASLAFPKIEAVFQLPDFTGDPYDYEKSDVRVQLRRIGGGVISIPAFFDGGTTWRARHTPTSAGQYQVASVTLNGLKPAAVMQVSKWQVNGTPDARLPGLVRVTADKSRFAWSNGTPYYPLGHNQPWRQDGLPDIPELFDKMGAVGENWSRVWMNHWDGKNLDWPKPGEWGTLNLEVARRWDSIVNSAERNGIAFQLVFQHHGQYSTSVNPNWGENPYNVALGGFLKTPKEFFTNEQARKLTKRKLRYSVARWGYSPTIMAWELFNEVQFTDAGKDKEWDIVAKWHREMADFLRQQDVYDHLITTSSAEGVPLPVWESADFYQTHAYPSDVVTAMNAAAQPENGPKKPFFVGEFGPGGAQYSNGNAIHAGLWAGLMSNQAGAPQLWAWDNVERNNLYSHFGAAQGFVKASGLAGKTGLKKVIPILKTAAVADLNFGPGGGWGEFKQADFVVNFGGAPEGIGEMPRYLQGEGHREMAPKPLLFRVNYPRAGQFVVEVDQVARQGARLILEVGDQKIERDFLAAATDVKPEGEARRVVINVPAGQHTISLQNTGVDWAAIGRFTLTNYASALGSYALSGTDFGAAWVYNRANLMLAPGKDTGAAASGQVTLPKLAPGRYRATWWDTMAGKPLSGSQISVSDQPLTLETPKLLRDAGLFVVREK